MGTTVYSYALGGQLYTEDGPWSNDTVTNTYNNRLRTALSLAQPTKSWTNAFYCDAAKRLTNVTSQAGSFTYTLGATAPASPLIKKLALPHTSYLTNNYDTVARLLFTKLNNSSHTTLNSHTYAYNPGNQRTQQVFSAGSTYNYTHDKIGQLKVADSATASEDRGYTYDSAWNLNYRTNNGTLDTFTVDGLNQLTNSTPGGVSTYDGNGNLISSGATGLEYAYDDENRLIQLVIPDYWKTDFTYDGLGRLRKRVDYESYWDGMEWLWALNSEVRYVYDGMRVIQERSSGDTPLVSYTRGTDLSGSLEGAGGIGGLLARSHGYWAVKGLFTTHNYYHADGNGNITYLVDSAQSLAASYRYDPYGNTLSSSGTYAGANTYRFSSKMVDELSGLYYYGYRWYAPSLQRWPNRDPIGEEGGVNLYGFVFNNPVGGVDDSGKAPMGWPVLPPPGYPPSLPRPNPAQPIARPPRPQIPDPNRPSNREGWIQRWTFFGGRCCNRSGSPEWALVDGQWHQLADGDCTPTFEDCDGMTCGGGFYTVGVLNGTCRTPRRDHWPFSSCRWTPTTQGPNAEPAVWNPQTGRGRGSLEGNTPPGYEYDN